RIQIRETAGIEVNLQQLAWEPLVPRGDVHDAESRHGCLFGDRLLSAFGSLALAGNSQRSSEPIDLTGIEAEDAPVVIKLLATDNKGRRVVAWGELRRDAE